MKTKILMAVVVSLLVILVVTPGIPAGNKGQGNGRSNAKAPEIESGMFINRPLLSPPWYPSSEETRHFRLYKRIHWASDDLPVDCMVYTSNAPSGAFAAVTPAFAEWDDSTGADIYGTISENDSGTPPGLAGDGSNTVCWGTIDGPGGIVAITYFSYLVDSRELIEFDILFDDEEPWSTTGVKDEEAFDVQNVMTHELGHTLILDDLTSPKTGALTMHAYTWLGDTWKQTLGLGDILGIQKIYGE